MKESSEHKFTPAWWLRGPHLQTLWSQFFRRGQRPALQIERLETPDGDFLFLCHLDGKAGQPRLLLLHGLEGSVDSHYVAGFMTEAARRGWSATLLLFRGCGPELNAGPRLYHSGETGDLDFVVDVLIRRAPGTDLFLAGVSLGGNVLLKWLGERNAKVPVEIRGAGAISVPFDLEAGARNLQRGFAKVYDRHFLGRLRAKANRKLAQHPRLFDPAKLAAARTIEDFDEAVTAPVHGFAGSHDYYQRSSSLGWLSRIHCPTLLLSAEDDPFLPPAVLDDVRRAARENPNLCVEFSPGGGHVGFVTGRVPGRPEYWAEARLMAFFDSRLQGAREPDPLAESSTSLIPSLGK